MAFPDEAVEDAKAAVLEQIEAGSLSPEEGTRKILDLDPGDLDALLLTAVTRHRDQNWDDALSYCRRALEAHPCHYRTYVAASQMLLAREQPELATAMLELGFRKIAGNDEFLEEFQSEWARTEGAAKPGYAPPSREQLHRLVSEMLKRRTSEPRSVTDWVRPYRLVHEVQDPPSEGLSPEAVDRIVECGASFAPLLVGVLRGWVENELPDGNFQAQVSLALLGEIGALETLPALLQLTDEDTDAVRIAAQWAVCRMADRHPRETLAAIRKLVEESDQPEIRGSMALTLALMAGVEGAGDALAGLLQGLARMPVELRNLTFLIVASALLTVEKEAGRARVQALLSEFGPLLERSTMQQCRTMLNDFKDDEPLTRPSVYEMCSVSRDKFEDLDEDEEDEEEEDDWDKPRPQVLRPVRPGRNDPCWCGSGQKYKKCHLTADEEADAEHEEGEDDAEDLDARVSERLFQFLQKHVPPAELGKAAVRFGGRAMDPSKMDDAEQVAFMEWMMYDYTVSRFGRSLAAEYLERHRNSLLPEERQWLEQMLDSRYSLFEVQKVRRGAVIELRDLLVGDTLVIHDLEAARSMAPGECVLCRVVDREGENEFGASVLDVPVHLRDPLRDWAIADRNKSGQPWSEYLRANADRLRLRASQMYRV